jgi:ATP-dependent DNA helicase RecG
LEDSRRFLSQDIEFLKGVGPQRGEVLRAELGLHSFRDLLHHFPFRYIDKSKIHQIAQVREDGSQVQLKGRLTHLRIVTGKRKRLEGAISDGTGIMKLVWFQRITWVEKALTIGREYLVYGRLNNFKGNISIVHPEMELWDQGKQLVLTFDPVYNSTEKLSRIGLDAKGIRKLMRNLFEVLPPGILSETIPAALVRQLKLVSRYEAFKWIHFPKGQDEVDKARMRLKFEEIFFLQLEILSRRRRHKKDIRGLEFSEVGRHFNEFFNNHLAFELTGAQKRVLREIRQDTGSGRHMNRLLQGDVGSGKTVVGLMTMLLAKDNGYQSCLLAPTEVLASQHYKSISEMVGPMDISVAFLSGSIKGKDRKGILEALAAGEIDILIGTHAILEDPVVFKNLGLAITDEQHRFGVAQRAKLWKKGLELPPHILVMTATPIPRTLAMTLYGDLHVSVIDELPPGRKEVKTIHIKDGSRSRMYKFMKEQIKEGRQVFVVYPLIEESSKLDLQNLMDGYEDLLHYFPLPEYRIAVVHGKMSPSDKDEEMTRFANGTAHIMVATTVIEVGVNVPNATVMVIENAERFGLSQLHQLRGRVGRGGSQSYCILMTSNKLTHEARRRMATMCATNDGFKIAEVDLELRGPGNIEGKQQSGVLQMKVANLATDGKIIETARVLVERIFDQDPELTLPQHLELHRYLKNKKKKLNWGYIS